ncbi:shikimate dehydrogenase [Shimia sp. W99]
MSSQIKAGLVGHGIAGSLTPLLHEAEGRALGLNYRYLRIDTALAEHAGRPLRDLISMLEDQGFCGVNVTHPYKGEAAALADESSPIVADLGAANTVVFKDGKRVAHNTDYVGFRSALQEATGLGAIRSMLLLGAGGAGSAVALALLDQGCDHLTICDPAPGAAERLAHRLRGLRPARRVDAVTGLAQLDAQLLDGAVNATPLGMEGHPGMAMDPAILAARTWVGDIVYFPLETELLKRARARRLNTLHGGRMAVFQAVSAFHLLTGHRADADRMSAQFQNLVSAGSPPVRASGPA